jgi:hypothetical protein
MYMVKTEDGGLIPPCRRADGTNHIDGVLEFLNREMQFDLFKQLHGELADFRRNPVVFLAPLPCYVDQACCDDKDHVSNRASPDYKKLQETNVYNARQNIKNFAFRLGMRNSSVISSWGKVKHLADVWAGPTQLRMEGYKLLAEAVGEAVCSLSRKRGGEQQKAGDNPAKKPRQDQQTGNGAGPGPLLAGVGPTRGLGGGRGGGRGRPRGVHIPGANYRGGGNANINTGGPPNRYNWRGSSGGRGGHGGQKQGRHGGPSRGYRGSF